MLQILHFADLHLDASFTTKNLSPAVGDWQRRDLRATLGRILTLARERQVDMVTIAGDLYEQAYTQLDMTDFLKQQFTRLAPIRIFIAPGQHDSYTNESLYALTEWPENVTIFSQGKLSAVEIMPGIHLWGAAHPPRRGHSTLSGFQITHQGINLLLLHAADIEQSAGPDSSTFSVDAAAIRTAGFDFALLGGQHNGRLWPDESPCCVYPGSPEPLSLAEANGAHQVVLLTIEDNRCTPELIPISQWRYRSLKVDLTGCESIDEAAHQVKQALFADEEDDERLVVYVTLVGEPDFMLDVEALAEAVETKAYLHYDSRLSLAYDLEQLSQELTVRGVLVRRFQDRLKDTRNDQERQDLLNALHFALQALEGKQVPLFYEVVE